MQKTIQMKKFLFVLAIGAFAACNNAGSDKAASDSAALKNDSSKMSADSSKMAMDSTAKKDTTTKK